MRPVRGTAALAATVIVVAALGQGCGARAHDAARHDEGVLVRTVEVAGTQRSYLVHLPTGYSVGRPVPVVLSFHGGAQDAERQRELSRLDASADAHGFVVVYPQGTRDLLGPGRTWNAGTCCGRAQHVGAPDVDFTSKLLDDLRDVVTVDPRRVYATGMSNGGMLAYRLACELSSRITAVAVVSGALVRSPCRPSRPVSVLAIHGTADAIVPVQGGIGSRPRDGGFPSLEESVGVFASADRCGTDPSHALRVADARVSSYHGCADGTAVEAVLVQGGGHTWPGGAPFPAGGATSTRTDADELAWQFFAEHPGPAATSTSTTE